jgi:sugar phosphate isomerase/epimerase
MTRTLGLAQLTALDLAPPQLVQLAAATGCNAVGIRLWPTAPNTLYYPLVEDRALRRETAAALRDTGVRILDVEVMRMGDSFDLAERLPTIDVSAELGAAHLNVVCDDRDRARLIDRFGALCDAAAPFGLTCDLEFMPWTALRNLADICQVLRAVDRPNAGLIIDALHFARAGCTLAELDAVPRAWLRWVQLCDGPIPGPTTDEGLIHAARRERLLPGEGDIDLVGLLRHLPPDLPVSIEVPSESCSAALGHAEWARRAKAATDVVLARALAV